MPGASPCFNYFLPVNVLLPPNYFLLLLIFRINCKLCRSCYSPNKDLWDTCRRITERLCFRLLRKKMVRQLCCYWTQLVQHCRVVGMRGRSLHWGALNLMLYFRSAPEFPSRIIGFVLNSCVELRQPPEIQAEMDWTRAHERTHTHMGSSVISGLSQLWYPPIHIQGYCIQYEIIWPMKKYIFVFFTDVSFKNRTYAFFFQDYIWFPRDLSKR